MLENTEYSKLNVSKHAERVILRNSIILMEQINN